MNPSATLEAAKAIPEDIEIEAAIIVDHISYASPDLPAVRSDIEQALVAERKAERERCNAIVREAFGKDVSIAALEALAKCDAIVAKHTRAEACTMSTTPPEDVREAAKKACDLCGVTPSSDMRVHAVHVAATAILAERERKQPDPIVRIRPHLRDCPFCKAKGSDAEKILFTAETDVIDQFEYGFTIRCTGCGTSILDEYEDEVIRLWNGEDKPVEED